MERLADSCGKYLAELMNEKTAIVALDGDLADSDGAIHVHDKHPDRFIMCGISEQCMVSMAAGMAIEGSEPWVFSFASFLCYRAYDQIRISVAQCNTNVKLIGSHSGGFTGRNGQSHASLNDIALMASLPNMKIYSPSSPEETIWAIRDMNSKPGPAYLRLPREAVPNCKYEIRNWNWMTKKYKTVIIATGITVWIAKKLQFFYKQKYEIEIGLINVINLYPIPNDLIFEINTSIERVIVIEDHLISCGFTSLLKNSISNANIIEGFGWDSEYQAKSGEYEDVLKNSALNPLIILDKITRR